MTVTLAPDAYGLADDGRRWWAVQGNVWAAPWMIAAPQARMAVAEMKRDMFDVETRYNGWSHRDARTIIRSQEVTCVGGPYTTPDAFDLDVRWRLAWAVVNTYASITCAAGPVDTVDDCYPALPEREVAIIVTQCADMYRRSPA